jgi:hypothetical protein
MESRTVYFEEIGPENTGKTFELVEERLRDRGIKKMVIASTTGATAIKALDFFKNQGVKIIVIPHQFGFREKNYFPEELVKTIREAGHDVHFGTMLFHTDNFYGSGAPALMANLLRCFSQGVKVCFEITLMASDAGLLTIGEKVIAVAGTGGGSDTALVMQPAPSPRIRRLRVNEIICKPLNYLSPDESEDSFVKVRNMREQKVNT